MYLKPHSPSLIKRKNIYLKAPTATVPVGSQANRPFPATDGGFKVLVVNASQEMAKEITLQLTLSLPGCSIMYAPTISLARWIIARRQLDLVISSPILPDGSITLLQGVLHKSKSPPNVMVVGTANESSPKLLGSSSYKMAAFRRLGSTEYSKPSAFMLPRRQVEESIKTLSADLRNDLNNPLQEIVAMVFVAKANGCLSASMQLALTAIDNAARNMAQVVKGLEDKIRQAVHS